MGSVLAARRTPVIRRPTPRPRRMDGPRAHLGARTSVGVPELIACDMARMGCWQWHAVDVSDGRVLSIEATMMGHEAMEEMLTVVALGRARHLRVAARRRGQPVPADDVRQPLRLAELQSVLRAQLHHVREQWRASRH